MTRKLKALGLALFAVCALGATMASGASAEVNIFDSAVESTVLTGTSENAQVFTRNGVKLECTHAEFVGSATGKSTSVTSFNVVNYTTPTCSGPLGTEVHWDYSTGGCITKMIGTASKTGLHLIICTKSEEAVIVTPTVFGSSLCTIKLPSQETGGHYTLVNTVGGRVTLNLTIGGVTSTRTGSSACGPASDTAATFTGNAVIEGETGSGEHVNIEVT